MSRTTIRIIILSLLVLLGFLPFGKMSLSATYYVATDGNDANPGTLEKPFATLNKGAGVLKAGDTLYIRGGTYNQTVYIGNSGTESAPITVGSYPGEWAVIDGQDAIPGYWGVLFSVNGNYVVARDLEVKNSAWMGLATYGHHDQVISVKSHHNMENGILVTGDYTLVENCEVWWNCKEHEYAQNLHADSTWASGLTAARHPRYAILRRNKVWNNWGEGLSTYEAEYTTIEDNIVYDNWSTNVYLSDTRYSILQRNMVYCTPSSPLNGTGGAQVGIMLGDEQYNPASSDNKVINNFVKGCNRTFYWWQGLQGGGLVNALVAYNTFSSSDSTANFQISSGTHSNTRIENNIIEQPDSLPVAIVGTKTGLSFSNNLWSKTPPANASGTGDVVGDPKLAKTGQTGAGLLAPEWFRILSNSPARDHAKVIPEVTEDYFRTARGQSPDIGAHEYVAADIIPPAVPRGLRVQ